jgi:large subunit ribosomal protein L25
MKSIKLKARRREEASKKNVHKLRQQGEIPGVLYGHKKDPVHLALPEHEFWTILHNATSEHLILDLEVEGVDMKEHMTLVRDVQHHPVSGDVLHVDFQRISMNESIKVGVPVHLKGMSRGVKEFGGILDQGVREVMITTTAANVPEHLDIDISSLMIGDTIHISDLVSLYPDIDFLDEGHINLAHVSPPKKMEDLTEAVEGEEEEVEGAEEGETAEDEAAEGKAAEGKAAEKGKKKD